VRVESTLADPLARRVLAKIAAATLKAPASAIAAAAPEKPAAGTLFAAGRAALLAARDLEVRLRERAGASPSAILTWEDAGPCFVSEEEKWSVPPGEVVGGTGTFTPATTGPDAAGMGTPFPVYGFAAALVAVSVDVASGRVAIREAAVAADVGRAVAAVAQKRRLQERAVAVLARMFDGVAVRTPAIACHLIEDAEPCAGLGIKWLGEEGGFALAPALANALHDALGRPVVRLPVKPEALAAALRRGQTLVAKRKTAGGKA
jgi:CO/xanthine dehydrogenase Mo-binding subunit